MHIRVTSLVSMQDAINALGHNKRNSYLPIRTTTPPPRRPPLATRGTLAAAASRGLYPPSPASPPPERPPVKPCAPQGRWRRGVFSPGAWRWSGGRARRLRRREDHGSRCGGCWRREVAACPEGRGGAVQLGTWASAGSRRSSGPGAGCGMDAQCVLLQRRPVSGGGERRGGGLASMAGGLFSARSRSGRTSSFAGLVASGAVHSGAVEVMACCHSGRLGLQGCRDGGPGKFGGVARSSPE
jgi:hypothetical protein